jgi:hypothetical protein
VPRLQQAIASNGNAKQITKSEKDQPKLQVSTRKCTSDVELLLSKVGGAGSRVAVYWPLDDKYYDATVLRRFENIFYFKYDDNEIEWLDLSKNKFKILNVVTDSDYGLQRAAFPGCAKVDSSIHRNDFEWKYL